MKLRTGIEAPRQSCTDFMPASRSRQTVSLAGSVLSNVVLPTPGGPKIASEVLFSDADNRSSAVIMRKAIEFSPCVNERRATAGLTGCRRGTCPALPHERPAAAHYRPWISSRQTELWIEGLISPITRPPCQISGYPEGWVISAVWCAQRRYRQSDQGQRVPEQDQ